MRLTDEQLEFIKKWMAKCEEKDEIPTNGMTIGRLLEHIEALQQENTEWQENYEELDAGHSKLYKAYCEIKQENKQLQTQEAQYRERLEQARAALKSVSYRSGLGSDEDGIREALAAIDKIGGREE